MLTLCLGSSCGTGRSRSWHTSHLGMTRLGPTKIQDDFERSLTPYICKGFSSNQFTRVLFGCELGEGSLSNPLHQRPRVRTLGKARDTCRPVHLSCLDRSLRQPEEDTAVCGLKHLKQSPPPALHSLPKTPLLGSRLGWPLVLGTNGIECSLRGRGGAEVRH